MSPFTDFLEFDIGVSDIRDIEPEEIRILCEDPVFRKIAEYCLRTRGTEAPIDATDPCSPNKNRNSGNVRYDRDELGIDPEDDDECPS